jgi:hypothetical protein
MIVGFFLLVAIAVAIGIGIIVWRDMKTEDKLSAVKTAGFAMVCCLLALIVLSFIVILF